MHPPRLQRPLNSCGQKGLAASILVSIASGCAFHYYQVVHALKQGCACETSGVKPYLGLRLLARLDPNDKLLLHQSRQFLMS
eukprot:6461811-Amphidinium_carterae.2